MTRVYASKVDRWLVVIVAASALAATLAAWRLAALPGLAKWLLAVPILALGAGLPLWLLAATRYALGTDMLRIRSGPFRWEVPLRDITGITPTCDASSSPALSLDRLRIDYGVGRHVLISPRDREAFVRELEARRASSG